MNTHNTTTRLAFAAAVALTSMAGLGGAVAAPSGTIPRELGASAPIAHRVAPVWAQAPAPPIPASGTTTTRVTWTHRCGWTSLHKVNVPGETSVHCYGCNHRFTIGF